MFNLFKYELLSRRVAIIGWGLGLAFFGILYVGLYPEVAGMMEDIKDISVYQAMGINLAGFEGYLASTAIQFLPVILGIFSIINGTGILAGEEDNGTLELVLTSPLKRWQIVTMKALALAIVIFLILVIAGLGNVFIFNVIDVDTAVTSGQLFLTVLNAWPIVMAFTMISLWLGTFMPSRRLAALAATVIFLANFFGMMMLNLVESLDSLKKFLLFDYYDSNVTVFTEGVKAGDVLLLAGVAVVFYLLALFSFQRRDVTVGAWPWQR